MFEAISGLFLTEYSPILWTIGEGRHIGKLMWLAPDCRSRSIGTVNWNKNLEPLKGKVKSPFFQTPQLRAQKTNLINLCLYENILNWMMGVIKLAVLYSTKLYCTHKFRCRRFRSFFRWQRFFKLCLVNNTLSHKMKSFILVNNFPICPSFAVSGQEIHNESNKISVNCL